jgi:hypothetical protein
MGDGLRNERNGWMMTFPTVRWAMHVWRSYSIFAVLATLERPQYNMFRQKLFLFGSWLLVAILTTTHDAFSFQPQPPIRWRRIHPRIYASSSMNHDFSSPYFWDEFYEQQLSSLEEQEEPPEENNKTKNSTTSAFVFEWHDSISLPDLAALVPPDSSCLMVGCGNSFLPQAVLDRNDNIHITLLDTSRTCLEQLQDQYCADNVTLVCGSATEMASHFVGPYYFADNPNPTYFDSIVDKGLTDALMCGDGWERPMEKLLKESSKVFHPQRGGRYILVSYKIGAAIQELFQEMCDAVSEDLVWEWEFDTEPLSNHRVSVSIATVRPKEQVL